VLPPISTAFPTSHFPVDNYSQHYSQPRSSGSPARNYDTASAMYGSYPPSIPPTTFYDQDYSLHTQYNSYSAAPRSMNHTVYDPSNTRRHATPPSSTYTGMDDRWSHSAYPTASHHTSSSTLYSPAASYPQHYSQHHHQADPYACNPYPTTHDHVHVSSNPNDSRVHSSSTHRSGTPVRAGTRGPSPGRASIQSPTSPAYLPPSHPSESSQAQQEAAVKKKRRRADANQLKILNEVWERTAFPSTEERAELAKRLEMSPRSVQIWFQNKRQNLRQSSRQSNIPPHQPFGVSPTDEYPEDVPQAHYRSTNTHAPLIGHSGHSRSPPVASSSAYRRGRS
jgi:homeobox protein YOX1/YHP1